METAQADPPNFPPPSPQYPLDEISTELRGMLSEIHSIPFGDRTHSRHLKHRVSSKTLASKAAAAKRK